MSEEEMSLEELEEMFCIEFCSDAANRNAEELMWEACGCDEVLEDEFEEE